MSELTKEDARRMLSKYGERFAKEFGDKESYSSPKLTTTTYQEFKKESLPKQMGWYEKGCNLSEKVIKLKLSKDRYDLLTEQIRISHLAITPYGCDGFAVLFPIIYLTLGFIVSFALAGSLFFGMFFLITGVLLMMPLRQVPEYIANSWRMKASNQMVLCVFYIVTYMRHTSNIEGAINFAAEHLTQPLSLDLKKVIWDVETGEYESVRQSLDAYLTTWRKYNIEFIEAIHLIESSLYEGEEERRVELLDKSLDVILTETYERMLHYAQNLKSPITVLDMMGIVLPILGLVILPMVASFLSSAEGGFKWYHLAMVYNVVLPIVVFYMGKNILSTRPTGYGDTDIAASNPTLKKYKNVLFNIGPYEFAINPIWIAGVFIMICAFIGLMPVMIAYFSDIKTLLAEGPLLGQFEGYKFLDYRAPSNSAPGVEPSYVVGPYGLGASLISLFLPMAFGVGLGIYYTLRSKNLIEIRQRTKELEDEFASALFQLGSRLGDGMPAEMAFGRVAEAMEGTNSAKFFELVSTNVRRLGMGVRDAIYNPKNGAILFFPSQVIDSSMKVLLESIRKGPGVAAQALMNVSRYIKEIHRVDERLKDLMADIVASMQSNINFMAPVISGIVVGITSMITTILGNLKMQAGNISGQEGGAAKMSGILEMFGDAIPTYHFQIVVGLYVVQVIWILTILSNGIQNGADSLNERYLLGKNLIRSTMIYVGLAAVVILFFNILAVNVISKTVG